MTTGDAAIDRPGSNVYTLPIDIMSAHRLLQRSAAHDEGNALEFAARRTMLTTAIVTVQKELKRLKKVLDDLHFHCLNPAMNNHISTKKQVAISLVMSMQEIIRDSDARLRALEDQLRSIDSEAAQIR